MLRFENLSHEMIERLPKRAQKIQNWSIGLLLGSLGLLIPGSFISQVDPLAPPTRLVYTQDLQTALNRQAEEKDDNGGMKRVILAAEDKDFGKLRRTLTELGLQENYGAKVLLAQVAIAKPSEHRKFDFAAVASAPEALQLDNPRLLMALERAAYGNARSPEAKAFEADTAKDARVLSLVRKVALSTMAIGLLAALSGFGLAYSLRRRQRRVLALLSNGQPRQRLPEKGQPHMGHDIDRRLYAWSVDEEVHERAMKDRFSK